MELQDEHVALLLECGDHACARVDIAASSGRVDAALRERDDAMLGRLRTLMRGASDAAPGHGAAASHGGGTALARVDEVSRVERIPAPSAVEHWHISLRFGPEVIVTKPKLGVKQFLEHSSGSLVEVVKGAANVRVAPLTMRPLAATGAAADRAGPKLNADAVLAPSSGDALARTTERVVAIGTAMGGTQALEVVLKALPRVAPGIVVVQHMPEKFNAAFASRLNGLCQVEVREAQNNDRVLPGRVLIAPGGRHMVMKRSGAQYFVEVVDGPLANRHKPSVVVLFRSVAKYAGKDAPGVMMTGVGDDGAAGLKEMLDAGVRTIGQDEATCVVHGMPAVARQRGAVGKEVPLQHIVGEIMACQ